MFRRNLFLRSPKLSTLEVINISKYVRWDIDKMIEALKRDVGWEQPQSPKLPMRFDCMIDASLMAKTFVNAVGLADHCIICNNLIYNSVRTKKDLKDTAEYYNNKEIIEQCTQNLMSLLNLK